MISPANRLILGALVLVDLGVGLFLIGAAERAQTPWGPALHAGVAVVAVLLALPAAVAAVGNVLPPHADDGVLANIGALVFMAVEVSLTFRDPWRASGVGLLVLGAAVGTAGLYVALFRERLRGEIP